MRVIHCTFHTTSHKDLKDIDEESLASVSSEELEREDGDEDIGNTDEMLDDMNKALGIYSELKRFNYVPLRRASPLLHWKRKTYLKNCIPYWRPVKSP